MVTQKQIFRLFDNHSKETILWCLKKLCSENRVNRVIHDNPDDTQYMRRQSIEPNSFNQTLLTKAAWIMSYMGESSIRAYWPMDYPFQLFIIGENNTTYDVTVFTHPTLQSLQMSVYNRRKLLLPKGVEDITVHIAMIPDEGMIKDIKPLEFDSCCILDENQFPKFIEMGD